MVANQGGIVNNKIVKIAHRGASGTVEENSAQAFLEAIRLGVDMIELDVTCCKSGELIVIHDDTVDRTTTGTGSVGDLTLDEIKQLRLRDGQEILTLEEALDVINYQCKLNIELKVKCDDVSQTVIDIIKEYVKHHGWHYDDFLISTFNHHKLLPFKDQLPAVKRAPLLHSIPITYAEFGVPVGAYSVNVSVDDITQEFIDDAHRRGFKLYAWVVNTRKEMEEFIALGVDGIFTDYPELFNEL
jgi:glycerophosphoryl diester phosphodiesterase